MSDQNALLTAIVGATVIDGTGSAPQTNMAVTVRGDLIEGVTPRAALQLPPNARVIDATGRFLLPGLVDSHVHLMASGYTAYIIRGHRLSYATLIAYRNLRSALQAGTTTIRAVCDPEHVDLALRSAVDRKMLLGPRIYAAGKGICMTGGHGAGDEPPVAHEVNGPQAVRSAVREEVKAGADFIKLLTSHRTDLPEFSQDEIDAGVDEAHRLGKRVAIHAANMETTRMSALAGVDTIEHGSFIDEKTADLMAEKDITLVPTLLVKHDLVDRLAKFTEHPEKFPWGDERDLDITYTWFRRCVERLPTTIRIVRERGVRIAAGTDFVFSDRPWNLVPEEIEWLTKLGLPPMDAIVAGTRSGAEALGLGDRFGTVEPGKWADLILTDHDPLKDISELARVTWVMKAGIEVPFSAEWERVPSEAAAAITRPPA
jgi:imidazolonepropionase-like amidohydrolase